MKVSVIITSYNNVNFLSQRFDSIMNQIYKDFEIIILDDCSNDGSQLFLEKIERCPQVIKIICKTLNSGSPFGLWEEAISYANGELIWIAESDDFCSNGFLNELVPFFLNSNLSLAYCSSKFFIESNKEFKSINWLNSFSNYIWDKEFVLGGKNFLKNYSLYKCPIINVSSVVFRKSKLKGIQYPADFRFCGDWFFWNQLFFRGDVAYTPKNLNFMRRHENAATYVSNSIPIVRILENTLIVKKSSKLIGGSIQMSEHYNWLLLMWKKYIYANPLKGSYYLVRFLPFNLIRQLILEKIKTI